MNKTEQELVEQLINQLVALDDPTKRVYLKSFDLQTTLNIGYTERRYLVAVLEENK